GDTIIYSSQADFTTLEYIIESGTVTDVQGNTYKTIKIGDQWWMAENLKSTHYSDGTAINYAADSATWVNLGKTGLGYCYYDNESSNATPYGVIYNWQTAMRSSTTESVQGVCPSGWHLPSDEEWKTLEKSLGMSDVEANNSGWRGNEEGNALKDDGADYWLSNNTGTNTSGFTAVGSGYRTGNAQDDNFYSLTDYAEFWTSTFDGGDDAWYRILRYSESRIRREHYLRSYGRSVRCVKN
ncbi:MAG: hypothetical protein HC831_23400, partial [Chloroflexia bacterium]|nr:hypothetical protein [Chloroflexia bacterium]